jgi:small conductance mechanosensitive channel
MWLFGNIVFQMIATIVLAGVLLALARAIIPRIARRLVGGYEYATGRVPGHRHDTKIDAQKREQTLSALFRAIVAIIIWIVTIVVLLWESRVNVTALVTGAGLVGIVVGLGAQNTIRDLLAGIFVISENQYRVGDVVTLYIAGQQITGVVEDVTVRITRLRDMDGKLHTVRNGSPDVVANQTFEYANVNLDFSVTLDSDVDKVEKILNEVGAELATDVKWKELIVEPIRFLRVEAFEESTMKIKALGRVEPSLQWDVAGEFRRRLKKAFDKNHISLS